MPTVPTLATPRLILRPTVPADAAAIVALLAGDRPGVEMTGAIPWPVTLEGTLAWIATLPEGDDIAWAITRRDSGALIGSVGLRGGGRVLHLGYWVGQPHRGQGFATEAAGAAVEHAQRSGAWEVRAEVMLGNAASVRVLQAVGFRHVLDAEKHYALRGGNKRVQEFALDLRAGVTR